ncbi:MAG: hypothetical protein ABIR32_18025 [Ilumatobacteraceae bacterium]
MNTKSRFSKFIIGAVGVTTLLGLSACNSDKAANDALKDAGVEANVNTGGGLPAGFPKEVVTPDLKLETGIAAVGTFTLRYTSPNPAADTAAYRDALTAAGFTVSELVDHLADPAAGGNVAFTASSAAYTVVVSAFSKDAPGGGNYMGVVVTPA